MMRWSIVLFAVIGAAQAARAEPNPWRLGATAGPNRSSLGGTDIVDSGGGFGYQLGGRAAFAVLPWLVLAGDIVYVRRQVDFSDGVYSDWRSQLDITRFDVPIGVRLRTSTAPVSGFLLAGFGVSLGATATHPVSSEGGEPDVDIAGTDLFVDGGAGIAWRRGISDWSLDIRYRHGLRSIDPESPGLDVRVHSFFLEAAVEWQLR